jgi:hypothetical protein
VKTNIVHTLFRVQKYGLMSIDQFKDILSPADLERDLYASDGRRAESGERRIGERRAENGSHNPNIEYLC